MFKLLKELTKPPEVLARESTYHSVPTDGGHPYVARSSRGMTPTHGRSRSNTLESPTRPGAPSAGGGGGNPTPPEAEVEVEETEEEAKAVVELLKALEKPDVEVTERVMHIVETLSQILSVKGTFAARRAFRRHRGFKTLLRTLGDGLMWRAAGEGVADEEAQVSEVQRYEGVRLALEVLSWALHDRENSIFFDRQIGYITFLPFLHRLSPISSPSIAVEDPSSSLHALHLSLQSLESPTYQPDPQILALLLAHMLSNNYSTLSIFTSSTPPSEDLAEKLGESTIQHGRALQVLWAYLWGYPEAPLVGQAKGKGKAIHSLDDATFAGHYEGTETDDQGRLVELTFRTLLAAASSSAANLFAITNNLPRLGGFLITRLYGRPEKRKYESTFPRDDWVEKDLDEQEDEAEIEWRPPRPSLRKVYLALLRKVLEAGVSQSITWRLFSLVREGAAVRQKKRRETLAHPNSRTVSPVPTTKPLPPEDGEASDAPSPAPAGLAEPSPKRSNRPSRLNIPSSIAPANLLRDRLNLEVLDLIRHAMKARWPDSFVFRTGKGQDPGGMALADMGRIWPPGGKGFTFACWIYINKLEHPITLFHASQSRSPHPIVQIRILENSQIGITTTVHSDGAETPGPDDEIICPAPDALIPHTQWVHFAIGLRKIADGGGEARLFVNGTRVGSMRVTYPVPIPPAPVTAPTLGVKPSVPAEAIRLSVGRTYRDEGVDDPKNEDEAKGAVGNEWMLGRTLLVEEWMPEDLVLLLHHLGPRYNGNMQEPLGKFLTYEAATSINIYLHAQAQAAPDKRLFTQRSNSVLVKAIRTGPAITEEHILLSLCARDVFRGSDRKDHCINAGVPHPQRARQLRHGFVDLQGALEAFSSSHLDETISSVGGGTVVLKMIDMANSPEELAMTLAILRDMLKDSWYASEEMERIHGFELLAAILRPKMAFMVDVECAKLILSILGIKMDRPEQSTVTNSVAYRALGLEFELWSHAPLAVVSLYLQHFEYLLSTSKHVRYNILRTFQKASMVKKLLYTVRSGLFDADVMQMVVGTLQLALVARWSAEDAIKPLFSYLVSALCQGSASLIVSSTTEPPHSQVAATLILTMVAELCHNQPRLVKLNRSVALHRLLVIFISSNATYYVLLPCLDILGQCLSTPGLESFEKSFEGEGGFALLARTLAPLWRADIQATVFSLLIDPSTDSAALKCGPMVQVLLAALDHLLLNQNEDAVSTSPRLGRRRSSASMTPLKLSAIISPPTPGKGPDGGNNENDARLEELLKELTAVYHASSAFRRAMTTKRVEAMIPGLADFAAVSGSSGRPDVAQRQREAAADWMAALIGRSSSRLPNSVIVQMKLLVEQLRSPLLTRKASTSSIPTMSPTHSPRPSTSHFGASFSGRLSSSTTTTPTTTPTRRRPSTEAGMGAWNRGFGEGRIPLRRVLTGESILEGGKDKNAAWKLIIIQTDSQAHSKMTLERKEHWAKVATEDWPKQAAMLWAENGLWPDRDTLVTWRLDGSEGPLRMRNRLERVNALPEVGMARTRHKLRDAIPTVDELSSAVSRVNAAPWEDPFALALGEAAVIQEEEPAPTLAPPSGATDRGGTPQQAEPTGVDDDSFVEVEENKDDKMRRIAKTLQAGDVVEEAHNIVRIVGVDACPGLLILGKKNLYLIDGLVQTAEGEVIDAKDAPKDALSIPSGTLVELDSADMQNARWGYNEIVENNKRAFLFRDVALELYFSDKRNFLVVFKDKRERQQVVQRLLYKNDARETITKSVIGNFVIDAVSRAADRSEQQLEAMTRRWQNREISNFAYLQLLNQYANRTPNDVTQYPVFPWVLSDYTSDVLELDKDSSFRNLTYPMGALTPARREAAVERYSATEGVGEKPFHFGTHYSSSMIVCGFMIRVSPFTEIFLALQGGSFDLADRLFSSVPRAWESASSDNRGDVRELIPEFFYSAAFLMNINHHDFGKKQISGDTVDHVALPPWAMGDALLFIHRHREALESDYVSRHLPAWIDLTFGFKQREPSAYNCFHPLSYRGAVDLERMAEDEKAASSAIIHNFGQTPLQIFRNAHPHRFITGRSELPTSWKYGAAEHWQMLMRSILPITESTTPIDDISEASREDLKPITQQRYRLLIPGHPMISVQYGFADGSMRSYHQDVHPRLLALVEGIYVDRAIFASPTLLVTVSNIGILTAWRVTLRGNGMKKGDVTIQREATLRGHTGKVTCLAASPAWTFVVTGSEDGTAIVWDTNRLRYIRTLQTPRGEVVKFCAINEADGHIALATKKHIYLFTMNGHPIASTSVDGDAIQAFRFGGLDYANGYSSTAEYTGGITFLNREFLKFGVLFVIGIGSELALYRCMPGSNDLHGELHPEENKPWTLAEQGRLFRSDEHSGGDCSMVKFIGERLYAAFKPIPPSQKYVLYQWALPEGQQRHVPESIAHTCMTDRCGRHFGLLEPKRYCGGCGGAFCGEHALHVEGFSMRYCTTCRAQLSFASVTGLLRKKKDSAMSNSRRNSGEGSRRSSIAPGSRRGSFGAGHTPVGLGPGTGGGGSGGTPLLRGGGSGVSSGFGTPLLG